MTIKLFHNVLDIPTFRRSLLTIDCLSERYFKTISYIKIITTMSRLIIKEEISYV